MDRLIYVTLSGAKSTLEQQAIVANNLANVSTGGFRAQVASFTAVPLPTADGDPSTRVFTLDATFGNDYSAGSVSHTGRDLDVAIQGSGWIAVAGKDGREAYTRAGSLQVSPNGSLMTARGDPVLSESGPLSVRADRPIVISEDGTVSQTEPGSPGRATTVGRIKLVDPPVSGIVRGDDGLFRMRDGSPAETSEKVHLMGGAVEGSNVNPAEQLVAMIDIARQFELQMKLLQAAESNDRSATQLLTLG